MQQTKANDHGSGSNSQGSGRAEEEDEWLVFSRCEKAKCVYTLLSCLRNVGSQKGRVGSESRSLSMTQKSHREASSSSNAGRSMQPVTVFVYPSSMTFHVVGKSKQIQASVNMRAGLFSQYNILHRSSSRGGNEDAKIEEWHSEGEFCVNLTSVLECISVLGMQSLERMRLTMSYNLSQEVFKVELTDDAGVLLTAAIPGMEPPEDDAGGSLALAMRSSPIAARIIVKSDTLREILMELESVGGANVGTVSLNSRSFDIAVVGDLSECLVSIPCRGDHVVSLDCASSNATYNFPLHSLLGSLRGLEIAEETCITINNSGMMAIQHQIIEKGTGDGTPSFVDFIMCCLDDRDDPSVDPDDGATQSQHTTDQHTTEGDYSQSLVSQRVFETDDLSRAESRAESRAASRASSTSKAKPRSGDNSRVGSHRDGRVEGRVPMDSESNDESDSDDDLADSAMASSAASLFGSVVRHVDPQTAAVTSRRSTRRRLQSSEGRTSSPKRERYDSDGSRDLLADSSDDEVELQELDVSARRNTSNNDMDRGNTSSPELFYGRQE